jgi:excisionase family DNA binding protein
MRPEMDEELLTPRELAAKLKISQRTLQRLVRAGRIRGCQVGGQIRFEWLQVKRALPMTSTAVAVPDYSAFDLEAELKSRAKALRVMR